MMVHTINGIADKPHPQEQYFQESPFLIGQGIPGKTGPQERGEEKRVMSSIHHHTNGTRDPIPHVQKSSCGFHTSRIRRFENVFYFFSADGAIMEFGGHTSNNLQHVVNFINLTFLMLHLILDLNRNE